MLRSFVIVVLFLLFVVQARAKALPSSKLQWDGKDGQLFELEITSADQTNVLLTKKLKENSFEFLIPGPGTYHWRVRQQKDGKWSPFSPFTEISAEDKITLLEKPLMKKSFVKENTFTFEWNEPYPDFKYTLSIYRGKNKTPIKSFLVKGGTKSIKLKKDQEKIYWSVTAESVHGTKSTNRKKFLVPDSTLPSLEPVDSDAPVNNQYIVRLGYQHFSSSYEQSTPDTSLSTSNQSESLSGSAINFRGEAWRGKYGIIAGMRKIALSSGDTDYSEIEFMGDLGYKLSQYELSSHILAVGFNSSAANLKYLDVDADYTKHFFTFRYQYDRKFSERFSTTIETTILQAAKLEFITPSFRIYPMLNWHLGPHWWLSFLAGFEMNKSTLDYKENGSTGELDFESRITVYGIQLNWKSF